MIRRFLSASAAVAALFFAGDVSAQNQIEGSLGIGVPTGDLSEYWNSSIALGAGAFLEISPFAMAGVSLGYDRFGLDRDAASDSDSEVNGGDFSAFHFCGELRTKTGSQESLVAYGGVGVGIYSVTLDDIEVTNKGTQERLVLKTDRENQVGGYLTAGLVVPITPQLKTGGKAQYHMFSVGKDHGFEDLSETRSFFSLQLTTIFFF